MTSFRGISYGPRAPSSDPCGGDVIAPPCGRTSCKGRAARRTARQLDDAVRLFEKAPRRANARAARGGQVWLRRRDYVKAWNIRAAQKMTPTALPTGVSGKWPVGMRPAQRRCELKADRTRPQVPEAQLGSGTAHATQALRGRDHRAPPGSLGPKWRPRFLVRWVSSRWRVTRSATPASIFTQRGGGAEISDHNRASATSTSSAVSLAGDPSTRSGGPGFHRHRTSARPSARHCLRPALRRGDRADQWWGRRPGLQRRAIALGDIFYRAGQAKRLLRRGAPAPESTRSLPSDPRLVAARARFLPTRLKTSRRGLEKAMDLATRARTCTRCCSGVRVDRKTAGALEAIRTAAEQSDLLKLARCTRSWQPAQATRSTGRSSSAIALRHEAVCAAWRWRRCSTASRTTPRPSAR